MFAQSEVLRLENISLHFASTGREVLKAILWSIHRGERWILFGRNGAGKTKLLEIMTGYLYPSEGAVHRFGMDRCDVREVRKHIGYVGTSLREAFPTHERSLDVVLSGIDATIGLYRDPKSEEITEARRVIETAGLHHIENATFGTLSEGEKQRVLMLRAAICMPDIMVLDEPADGLDLAAREEMLNTVERLAAMRDAAVIYVTHHVEEITPLFTKLFVLHNGGCLYSGDLESGLTGETLSLVFNRRVRVEKRHGRFNAFVAG